MSLDQEETNEDFNGILTHFLDTVQDILCITTFLVRHVGSSVKITFPTC